MSQGAPEAAAAQRPPKLLDRIRQRARLRHMSPRTEEAYVHWTRRFILFHGKRHPDDMGAPEVVAFLSSLAVDGAVGPSTQRQALAALVFLYRAHLGAAHHHGNRPRLPRCSRRWPATIA